jgi:hypothetical protein
MDCVIVQNKGPWVGRGRGGVRDTQYVNDNYYLGVALLLGIFADTLCYTGLCRLLLFTVMTGVLAMQVCLSLSVSSWDGNFVITSRSSVIIRSLKRHR